VQTTHMRHVFITMRLFLLCLPAIILYSPVHAGNTCGAATAITVGNCDALQVNGASTGTATTCTGTVATEEWWSFTAVVGASYTVTYTTTSSDNPAIQIFTACGTSVSCTNATGNGVGVVETVTFTATATTHRIRIINYNSGNMDGNMCVTGNPPSHNDPTGAIALTVGTSCSLTASTNLYATSSTCGTIPVPGCAGYSGGDVWFSAVVPASGGLLIETTSGVVTDGGMALYTGTPCGVLTLVSCNDNSGPGSMPEITATGLTPGSTVYIRFWENGNNNNGTFNICASNPCPDGIPANDECATATALTVYGSACTYTAGTISCATASADANSCGATLDDDDVWYSFVAPTTSVYISISNASGTTTDMYHSLYTGTCGSLGAALVCSDADASTPTGLAIGQTYYIRVYTNSTSVQFTDFEICVTEMSPCGNPTNNDWCSDPALLTKSSTATFTSATASTYTADDPNAQLDVEFCGTLQNNSYYQFVASATTESFDITSVSGCASNGIQAEVYEVTYDVNGCCTDFNSVSNCFNPGSPTTGTVTATGLTVGSSYILMIDGYSGANCDFVISGWSASGVLPVELLSFTGQNIGDGNELKWVTASEINNSHFLIQRSYDGVNFGTIGSISGYGTSNMQHAYTYYDSGVESKNAYYRLKQVDFDGDYEYSNTIVVYYKENNNVHIFPNPATSTVFVDLYAENRGSYNIRVIDVLGGSTQKAVYAEAGVNHYSVDDFVRLQKGAYIVQLVSETGMVMKNVKIIKQ